MQCIDCTGFILYGLGRLLVNRVSNESFCSKKVCVCDIVHIIL